MKNIISNKYSIGNSIHSALQSIWLFPSIVVAFVIILASFHISGSSVGMYDGILNSSPKNKSSLVNLEPRDIRSDEWLVGTQMTVAQYYAGFPVINQNIGQGQDMAVVLDVPYKDWSAVFKPQNLIFFIASLDFAFAFRWWFLGGLLAVSSYFFFLKLVPTKRLMAAIFGTIVFFTPLVQWWYLSVTILPLALGLLILLLLIAIHQAETTKRRLLITVALGYLLTTFGFVMYPPFQIPIVLMCLIFYVCFLIYKYREIDTPLKRKTFINTVVLVGGAAIMAVSILGIFIVQHRSVVETIANTAYPGKRIVPPGDFPLLHPFAGHLSVFLQNDTTANNYREANGSASNQSESSGIVAPIILLLVLAIFSLIKFKDLDITSRALLLSGVLVLMLFFCNMYIPFGGLFYNFIGLGLVPHNRLLIGINFVSFILLACLYRVFATKHFAKSTYSRNLVWIVFAVSLFSYLIYTNILFVRNPGFITNELHAYLLAALTPLWLLLFLKRKLLASLSCLALLAVISTSHVNPLQRSLDEITTTNLSYAIRSISADDSNARWITNNLVLENYALANGARSLSGVYIYPQLGIWNYLDPTGNSSKLYNRYAHVLFIFDDDSKPQIIGPSADTVLVRISPCDNFFKQLNVIYFYATDPINSKCLRPRSEVVTASAATIFIYTRHN